MNAVSMNNLWTYLQGLSLTASSRKWLAARLVEPASESHPVLQTWTKAISDLDKSEKEKPVAADSDRYAYAYGQSTKDNMNRYNNN